MDVRHQPGRDAGGLHAEMIRAGKVIDLSVGQAGDVHRGDALVAGLHPFQHAVDLGGDDAAVRNAVFVDNVHHALLEVRLVPGGL